MVQNPQPSVSETQSPTQCTTNFLCVGYPFLAIKVIKRDSPRKSSDFEFKNRFKDGKSLW